MKTVYGVIEEELWLEEKGREREEGIQVMSTP
jgi:hypothetical protein